MRPLPHGQRSFRPARAAAALKPGEHPHDLVRVGPCRSSSAILRIGRSTWVTTAS